MTEKHNGEEDINNIKLQELLDIIFKEVSVPERTTDHTPEYPESLLQQTQKANKYYNSFQGLTKQFIDESNMRSDVVRWSKSVIQVTLKSIVDNWQTVDVQGTTKSTEAENNDEHRNLMQSTANTLFSWSSGDSYIESRKRELQFRNSQLMTNNGSVQDKKDSLVTDKEIDTNHDKLKKKLHLELPKESITNKLNRIVDRESNKFIHKRIQLIKAHHSEQISKEIHERKRKDHERHLDKLKQKEEEYDRALQAATSEQGKQNGFFGSLFGFNAGSINNSHSIDLQPEIENPSPNRNLTSSPSNKNKKFSFLPTSGLSLWGNITSVNKGTKAANTKIDIKNPVSDDLDIDVDENIPHEASTDEPGESKEEKMIKREDKKEQDDSNKIQLKNNLETKEQLKKLEETTTHKNEDDYEIEGKTDQEQGGDEDEFEEYNSSLPNLSMVQEPIKPIITGTKISTRSTSHIEVDNDNLLEL